MRSLIVALALSTISTSVGAEPFEWPDGKKAAVVLTYDDAIPSHLDIAIPHLDAAGIRGTFFMNGTFDQSLVDRWKAAAANGHELGNHSVYHPCARGSFEMPERYNTENYTVDTMIAELRVMNNLLTALDDHDTHTYATPCGQTRAGGQDFIAPVWDSGLFTAIRGVAAPEHDPRKLDLSAVPSEWFPEDATGQDMIDAVKAVEEDGGLLVLGFHGVGGDYLIVPADSHLALTQYLGQHRDDIWVTTFREATDWIRERTSD